MDPLEETTFVYIEVIGSATINKGHDKFDIEPDTIFEAKHAITICESTWASLQ